MTNLIHPGLKVLIQRSDGRIHPAEITEVRLNTGSVCVEWRERNETKGKELLIDLIIDLNPLLSSKNADDVKDSIVKSKFPIDGNDRLSLSSPSFHLRSKQSPSKCVGPKQTSDNISCKVTEVTKIPSREDISSKSRKTMVMPIPPFISTPAKKNKGNQQLYDETEFRRTKTDEFVSPLDEGSKHSSSSIQLRQRSVSIDSIKNGTDSKSTDITTNPRSSSLAYNETNVAGTTLQKHAETKKTNCLREIQRIAQNRNQRRVDQGQQRKQSTAGNRNSALFSSDGRMTAKFQTTSADQHVNFANMIDKCRQKLKLNEMSTNVFCITNSQIPDSVNNNRITVSVRKRPLFDKEKNRRELDIVSMVGKDLCIVHSPKEKVDLTKYLDNHKFRFDYVFNEMVSTQVIYSYTVKPLIANILNGNHSMCFAYGQTGSGKTFTMGGNIVNDNIDCSTGIYALATKDIFDQLDQYHSGKFSIFCSFFEIYCGKVFDLFSRKKRLQVLEDQNGVIQVVNLKQEHVRNVDELMSLIQFGMTMRTSGTTSANENSSRSHAVFRISLKKNQTGCDYSRISLIDLAGSERGKDTGNSDRHTLMEGAEINKSLLALKECIRALSVKADHIPFRGSMLTRVLRDSFMGSDAMLSMIAMISPSDLNSEHTLNTLRYADRVKELGTMGITADEVATELVKNDVVQQRIKNATKVIKNQEPIRKRNLSMLTKLKTSLRTNSVEIKSLENKRKLVPDFSNGKVTQGKESTKNITKFASSSTDELDQIMQSAKNSLHSPMKNEVGQTRLKIPQSLITKSANSIMTQQLNDVNRDCIYSANIFADKLSKIFESNDNHDKLASAMDDILVNHIKYVSRLRLKTCAFKIALGCKDQHLESHTINEDTNEQKKCANRSVSE